MKPITVWKRYNYSKHVWEHNHIEDGHVSMWRTSPIGTPEQTKAWKKGTWKFQRKYLENNKVVDPEK